MIWLTSPDVRWANSVARHRQRDLTLLKDVMQVVLELVHPGNLGELPPAPRVLMGKARLMGLLTADENNRLLTLGY